MEKDSIEFNTTAEHYHKIGSSSNSHKNNPTPYDNINYMNSEDYNNITSKPKFIGDDLKSKNIWAYGVGHFLNDIFASIWFFFLSYYLIQIIGLEEHNASYVLLAGQIADALATPLVGIFSDKLNTRFGKRFPWYIGGTVLCTKSFILIFFCVLPENSSELAKLIYYSFFASVFNIGWASVQISHMSLLPCITLNPKKKDLMTKIRTGFTFLAQMLTLVFSFFYFTYITNKIVQYQALVSCCTFIGVISTIYFILYCREWELSQNIPIYLKKIAESMKQAKEEKSKKKFLQEFHPPQKMFDEIYSERGRYGKIINHSRQLMAMEDYLNKETNHYCKQKNIIDENNYKVKSHVINKKYKDETIGFPSFPHTNDRDQKVNNDININLITNADFKRSSNYMNFNKEYSIPCNAAQKQMSIYRRSVSDYNKNKNFEEQKNFEYQNNINEEAYSPQIPIVTKRRSNLKTSFLPNMTAENIIEEEFNLYANNENILEPVANSGNIINKQSDQNLLRKSNQIDVFSEKNHENYKSEKIAKRIKFKIPPEAKDKINGHVSWLYWLTKADFYYYIFVYMFVRLSINITSIVIPFYMEFVLKYSKTSEGGTPYEITICLLISTLGSIFNSAFLQKYFEEKETKQKSPIPNSAHNRAFENDYINLNADNHNNIFDYKNYNKSENGPFNNNTKYNDNDSQNTFVSNKNKRLILIFISLVFISFGCIPLFFLSMETRKLIFLLSFIWGIGFSQALSCVSSLINDVVGNKGSKGAFVYGSFSFADKLSCGLVLVYYLPLANSNEVILRYSIPFFPPLSVFCGLIFVWLKMLCTKGKKISKSSDMNFDYKQLKDDDNETVKITEDSVDNRSEDSNQEFYSNSEDDQINLEEKITQEVEYSRISFMTLRNNRP